jgi:hypothetical protein
MEEKAEVSYPPLVLCPSHWMNVTRALEMGLSEDAVKVTLLYLHRTNSMTNYSAAV